MTDMIQTPTSVIDMPDEPAAAHVPGDISQEMFDTDIWSDDLVTRAGIPIVDSTFVSCGGGMGSFIMVDYLRMAGVPTSQIRVLSNIDVPWQTYQYLTRCSQIPVEERLRSDSQGMPDNLWGFPSYALRESRQDKTLAPIWSVLTEPIFVDYWTPKAGMVFAGIEREAQRISYHDMRVRGQVRLVRRRAGGGYFTILTPPPGESATKRVAYRSLHVHLALGYPGLRFLPDLQKFRADYPKHAPQVVNAYEPHEQVYDSLLQKPGRVLVRGGGIVASRVLQRLMEDRMFKGARTEILHLFRTYESGRHNKWMLSRRRGSHGFAFQGFNAPKSAWGGVHTAQMKKLDQAGRKHLNELTGGAHTPYRKLWIKEMKQSREEGWYTTFQGEVTNVYPSPNGSILTEIKQKAGGAGTIEADFIIDCTGLEADIREHRVWNDLLQHSGVQRNSIGRVYTEESYEVLQARSGPGRMYASGSATYGNVCQGVDTFFGLRYSTQFIADDLASVGFGKKVGPGRAFSGWWKWMRHKELPK